jgi:tungstate transport system substrate-binding protein
MGPSLLIADQMQAYILADRGTYLAMRTKVDLVPLAAQTDELKNPYGIMVVNPVGKTGINESLAQQLVDFFVAPATQKMIRDFQVDGESLFYPVHPTASD